MNEHGAIVLAAHGHNRDPRRPFAIGDLRGGAPTYRPGVYDPRVATRAPFPGAFVTGTTAAHVRTADRMAADVEANGAAGSRLTMRHPAGLPVGPNSKVPLRSTLAGPFLEQQRAVIGDGFVYGSPVTDFSALAEAQSRYGGVIPETGAREVRRFTGVGVSEPTEIHAGSRGVRTAGITAIRGGAVPLHGTPVIAGVQSIVYGAPPPSFGRALAVGTETFGTPVSTGGPVVGQPLPVAGVSMPAPSGYPLTGEDYETMFPGYTPGEKAGTDAVRDASSASLSIARPPNAKGLLWLALLVVGGAVLAKRRR